MRTSFRKSFLRDLKKIKTRTVLAGVRAAIQEIEDADEPHAVVNLKKLSGSGDYYRIRVGDFRIGVVMHADVVDFVRCLPRRDLYRYFP